MASGSRGVRVGIRPVGVGCGSFDLAARFAAARKQLEDQLAQLDKNPPQLVLRDGFLLEYSRGTVVELSFRATDDYEVKSVKLMARPRISGGTRI